MLAVGGAVCSGSSWPPLVTVACAALVEGAASPRDVASLLGAVLRAALPHRDRCNFAYTYTSFRLLLRRATVTALATVTASIVVYLADVA